MAGRPWQCRSENLGQVHGQSIGLLLDLGAAAESVGNDQRVGGRGPDGRQQHPLPHRLGHLVVATLEAEVPGQPTAARVRNVSADPGSLHERAVGLEADHRVLMAVRMHERVAADLRRSPARAYLASSSARVKVSPWAS